MLAIMQALAAPNMSHVLFAVAGIAFGWWAKRHPDVIPPEFLPMVQALLAKLSQQKQAEAHATLASVLQPTPDLLQAVEAAVLKGLLAAAPATTITATAPVVTVAKKGDVL